MQGAAISSAEWRRGLQCMTWLLTGVWGVFQGAARSFAFGSGMAALSAVLRLVRSGEHVVAGDDIYGGTSRLLTRVAPDLGISVSNVDTSDAQCASPAYPCPSQIPACSKLAGTRTIVAPDQVVIEGPVIT